MDVRDLIVGELTLRVDRSSGAPIDRLSVDWLGKANEKEPGPALGPWFDQAAAAAIASGRSLEFRFEALDHFNSATILALMLFLGRLRGKALRLIVRYDPRRKWQKMTFDALRKLDREAEVLELVEGE